MININSWDHLFSDRKLLSFIIYHWDQFSFQQIRQIILLLVYLQQKLKFFHYLYINIAYDIGYYFSLKFIQVKDAHGNWMD